MEVVKLETLKFTREQLIEKLEEFNGATLEAWDNSIRVGFNTPLDFMEASLQAMADLEYKNE